jgi:hypothetical protein
MNEALNFFVRYFCRCRFILGRPVRIYGHLITLSSKSFSRLSSLSHAIVVRARKTEREEKKLCELRDDFFLS